MHRSAGGGFLLVDAFADFVVRFRERQRENEAQDRRVVSSLPVSSDTTDAASSERPLPRRRSSWAAPVQADAAATVRQTATDLAPMRIKIGHGPPARPRGFVGEISQS